MTQRKNNKLLLALLAGAMQISAVIPMPSAHAAGLFLEDSRVRTVVYSENGVFKLVTEYGYQSNIEFEKGEQIQTISVGNPVYFKITPAGDRLFVKALQADRHTNMTLVTNKRAYQFEISSIVENDADVVYVMRFYYPESDANDVLANLDTNEVGSIAIDEFRPAGGMPPAAVPAMPPRGPQAMNIPGGSPTMPPMGAPTQPQGLPQGQPPLANQPPAPPIPPGLSPEEILHNMPAPQAGMAAGAAGAGRNVRYSAQGPQNFAPLEIFDDGDRTYMKFAPQAGIPQIFAVNGAGQEQPLRPLGVKVDKVILGGVFPRLSLRFGNELVCIYNDALQPKTPQ